MATILRFLAYLVLLLFGVAALVFYVLIRLPMAALLRQPRDKGPRPQEAPESPSYMPRWNDERRRREALRESQWVQDWIEALPKV